MMKYMFFPKFFTVALKIHTTNVQTGEINLDE